MFIVRFCDTYIIYFYLNILNSTGNRQHCRNIIFYLMLCGAGETGHPCVCKCSDVVIQSCSG